MYNKKNEKSYEDELLEWMDTPKGKKVIEKMIIDELKRTHT